LYYASFLTGLGTPPASIDWALVAQAGWYSGAVLGILTAHEMGHYLACRYYNVDCTLPFFLPFLSIAGTLGAVIKIREAFPTRKALFDIGIAGPIAGFVVLVPLLFWAIWHSTVIAATPPEPGTLFFGEPLLFQAVAWLKFGRFSDAVQLNLHPVGFAAWFGMLATAWNLLPFGQLDGGHLTYASLGDRSRYVSVATAAGAVIMCFVSINWILMAVIMVAVLFFMGSRHPSVLNDYEPLGAGRYAMAVFAVIMFVLCFTPVPIRVL
jgi:membrane-associated protease RseP (regulator of RpoE activity)